MENEIAVGTRQLAVFLFFFFFAFYTEQLRSDQKAHVLHSVSIELIGSSHFCSCNNGFRHQMATQHCHKIAISHNKDNGAYKIEVTFVQLGESNGST